MPPSLEVCAGSLASAVAAQKGGANRIELCDNLSAGGTTPSPGVIKQAVKLLDIPVFVLVRPRPGDFLYSEVEFEAMKEDVVFCKKQGAKGIVAGILEEDGSIDMKRMMELVTLSRPLKFTFHRAFDMVADPFKALEEVITLGIDRILTSGQAPSAIEGADLIAELIKLSGIRITVMPGGGITANNVSGLIKKTGAKEFHASLRSPVKSRMEFLNYAASMGKTDHDEYTWMETDIEKVKFFLDKLI
jgi:copper homeostasis protein